VVHVMSGDYVRSLMLRHPTVAVRVVDVLARRLQKARESLEEMAFNDVTGRVAGLLLLLDPESAGVVEEYSHQELADMVGCLRESLTATLDRFKRSGAVRSGANAWRSVTGAGSNGSWFSDRARPRKLGTIRLPAPVRSLSAPVEYIDIERISLLYFS